MNVVLVAMLFLKRFGSTLTMRWAQTLAIEGLFCMIYSFPGVKKEYFLFLYWEWGSAFSLQDLILFINSSGRVMHLGPQVFRMLFFPIRQQGKGWSLLINHLNGRVLEKTSLSTSCPSPGFKKEGRRLLWYYTFEILVELGARNLSLP